jgi:hypothetical protein
VPAISLAVPRRSRVASVALLILTTALVGPALVQSADAAPTAPTAPAATAVDQPRLKVPVNVVLVGFNKSEVGAGLLAQLAPSGEPIVRVPANYGINQPVGIHYDYDYRLREASRQVTDQFFKNQLRAGRNEAATVYQAAYNAQASNRLDVTGPVLSNDARATQKWLDQNVARPLGIDVQHSYTVYLVNWWGRPDFRFHTYRVAKSVDHDTHVDWANDKTPFPRVPTTHWDQAALSAWGGTDTRSWFYDLSAGPDFNTVNWEIDHDDLDGDGYPDYRIPPTWEYAADGYRPRSELPTDLGFMVRYVAVNLLFTASPIYDPMVHQPPARGAARLHTTIFEGNPAIDGDALTDTPYAMATLRTLEPWLAWRNSNKDVRPTPTDVRNGLFAFLFGVPQPPGCWQDYGVYDAQLYCTLLAQQSTYVPAAGRDEVLPSFTFTGNDDELLFTPVEGYADDNWVDGTPTWTVQVLYPDMLAYGDGGTHVTTHEIGHELGVPHPHDGYDPTYGVVYSPTGGTYFAWIGDQAESVMSYTRLGRQFSVFDQDNVARDSYAGYLANMEPPGQRTIAQRLLVAAARLAFNDWRFPTATALAREAWALGAAQLPVTQSAAVLGLQAASGHPDPEDVELQRPDLPSTR